jgi:hypothetical protein
MKNWKRTDTLVIILASLIISFAGYFLYRENRVGSGEGKIVGNITFKYGLAQRKFMDSMLWNDVDQNFPAYNYDSIRTDEKSEAVIQISNKEIKVELDSKSMFILIVEDDQIVFNLIQGAIHVHNNEKKTTEKITVKAGDVNTNLNIGEFRVSIITDKVFISSIKGLASIQNKEDTFTINSNEGYLIEPNRIQKEEYKVQLIYPTYNRYFFSDKDKHEITLIWSDDGVAENELILSDKPDLSNAIYLSKQEQNFKRISLGEGVYYWKVKKNTQSSTIESAVGMFRLIYLPDLSVIAPKENETFYNPEPIYFHWKSSPLYINYILEISTIPSFQTIIREVKMSRNSVSLFFSEGRYYWRVTSFGNIQGIKKIGSIHSFTVEKETSIKTQVEPTQSNIVVENNNQKPPIEKKETINVSKPNKEQKTEWSSEKPKEEKQVVVKNSRPVIVYPANGAIVDMNTMDKLPLKWKPVPLTPTFTVTLYLVQSGTKKVVYQNKTTSNSLVINDLSILDVGKFTLEVSAEYQNETLTSSSSFQITLGEQPQAPSEISSGKKKETE